ncbi:MAG TPA: amidohydrolase [Candidatus Saccharimonadales bacterium]|nr:amidohydrolase [Candidatus Saccharimonadales bacterium]
MVITHTTVRTMDRANPVAEAVALSGHRIAAVGSNAEIQKLAHSGARVIHAGGGLVLPGFNDAHVHFLCGGFQLSSVDLRDAGSPEEFAERIGQFARKTRRGQWITGGGWDHELWPGSPLPAKNLIDSMTPDIPVLVHRLDGHMALANTLALRQAGVTSRTEDPPGGLIVRDPVTREPTGMLKDAAIRLVESIKPVSTFEDKLSAALAATEHAASLGVTSAQDMSADDDVAVFQTLIQRSQLKTRIYAMWPLPRWKDFDSSGCQDERSSMLHRGGLKGFSDGSLGSTTALFFDPYNDAPESRGLPSDEMFPEGAMLQRVLGADRAGLQLIIHAIGDKANDQVLTLFEQLAKANGTRDRRARIEHAQHLRPSDIPRFARAGVIASVQPYHCIDDGRWAERRIGAERCQTTYAFRSLLDAGALLAFGSDWPVAPLDPIAAIGAAVTRRTLDGKHPGGWISAQKVTVEEAVRAYTIGSAHAEFRDHEKGVIAPGMLADLVILDRDIFKVTPTEIEQAKVQMTITNGKVVYTPS